jgi:glycosyltransferase involved in cell wall biosynthesis
MASRPLSVALDATPLLGARTGVAAMTLGALRALAADRDGLGVDVSAYALTWRGRPAFAGALPDGVKAHLRPMAARPLRMLWRRADWPPIEWWTGPVDVVHGTNFVGPPARAAAVVVTVHDLTPLRYPELCQADTLAYPELIRRALRRGAWVHTPSRAIADEVVGLLGADPERVVPIASGVPMVERASPPAAAGGPPYLCAVGTVEPRKDHVSLVKAFDAVAGDHPDLRLVIAGPDGWGADQLAIAVAASPYRDRIDRLGWVPDDERVALVRGSTAFVFPSVYEGFGYPPLEAMAAGVPVVATSAGALPEVLGDAALLVAPGYVDALAGAITQVLDDAALRERLVDAGRSRVARYSWSAYARGLTDLYRRADAARS